MAHQRLAIVDPASGDQPLFNEDKSVVVTVGFTSLYILIYLFFFTLKAIFLVVSCFFLFFDVCVYIEREYMNFVFMHGVKKLR